MINKTINFLKKYDNKGEITKQIEVSTNGIVFNYSYKDNSKNNYNKTFLNKGIFDCANKYTFIEFLKKRRIPKETIKQVEEFNELDPEYEELKKENLKAWKEVKK